MFNVYFVGSDDGFDPERFVCSKRWVVRSSGNSLAPFLANPYTRIIRLHKLVKSHLDTGLQEKEYMTIIRCET